MKPGHELVNGRCDDCGWSGTDTDYLAAYKANQIEARGKYEWALARFKQFRQAGQITEKPEGGWVCQGPTAAQVLGDMIRWKSDLAHWSQRLAERAELVFPSREPGEDDDVGDSCDGGGR